MKKLTSLLAVLLVASCSTAPVVMKFPEKPQDSEVCPAELDKIPEQPKISEISKSVVKNYGTYHECAIKVNTWNEWYEKQKKIFESVK